MNIEIIAEIGQNHNGDIEMAKEMIKVAKSSGADVAKFQLYDAKKLFPPKSHNQWFDYNCKTELKKDDVLILADYAKKVGIEFMASVFDEERISWLEDAGVKRYKIASRSIYDHNLINSLIQTNKPLIVSLGMWNKPNFPIIKSQNKVDFLYCVSKYPTPLEDLNFSINNFNLYSGFSDHTIGVSAACYSFFLGARILEKHFTLNKNSYGPDHLCSMNPNDLNLINEFRNDIEVMRNNELNNVNE